MCKVFSHGQLHYQWRKNKLDLLITELFTYLVHTLGGLVADHCLTLPGQLVQEAKERSPIIHHVKN